MEKLILELKCSKLTTLTHTPRSKQTFFLLFNPPTPPSVQPELYLNHKSIYYTNSDIALDLQGSMGLMKRVHFGK